MAVWMTRPPRLTMRGGVVWGGGEMDRWNYAPTCVSWCHTCHSAWAQSSVPIFCRVCGSTEVDYEVEYELSESDDEMSYGAGPDEYDERDGDV